MNAQSLVGCLCIVASATTAVAASTLAPLQLEGIKGATVAVFVDRKLPSFAKLERRATDVAIKALVRDGNLAARSPDGSYLRVEVSVHRDEAHPSTRSFVLLTRVQWREPVRLVRRPSIGGGRGIEAVTWADQVIRIEDDDAVVEQLVLKDVDWLVGSFASAATSVRRKLKRG